MFVDPPGDQIGEGYKVVHAAAMQYKNQQLVCLSTLVPVAGDGDLAKLEATRLLRDRLEIVRVIILAVDKNEFLGAAGYIQVTLGHEPEITSIQPAVRPERKRIRFRILKVTSGHVAATNMDMAGNVVTHRLIGTVNDAQLAVANRLANANDVERRGRVGLDAPGAVADTKSVAVDSYRTILRARLWHCYAYRSLGQTVHRKHRGSAEAERSQCRQKLLAQRDRDRFGSVKDDSNGGQIDLTGFFGFKKL